MKNVFYNRLIAEKHDLSADERIVYSFLVYNAICNCEDVWDKSTGKFVDDYLNENDFLELPYNSFNEGKFACTDVAKFLNIGKATASRTFRKFEFLGIIDKNRKIIYHNNIFKEGYFDLNDGKLKGELLVFYSWLKDLKGTNQYIYANRNKLAELYHVKMSDVRWYLHRLKELDLVERQDDGKLLIK